MKGLPLSFFVFPPLCLFIAFSLNIIVVFLSCPGSRYCLTKYFMVHSTPYLPTTSYLLSKIKGSSFRGGRKKRAGLFDCFYFSSFSYAPNAWKHQECRRGAFYVLGTRLAIYLFICSLFIYLLRALFYDSQPLFLCSFPSYLFKREKFKAASSAEGEVCCILTLQRPPALTLREEQ